jgi:tetratricopeptide (TPR) repeat protein
MMRKYNQTIALCIAIFASLAFFALLPVSSAHAATSPEEASVLATRAAAFFKRGEYERALPLLEEALNKNPNDPMANRYMALYKSRLIEPYCKQAAEAYISGDFSTAVRNWELAIAASPSPLSIQRLMEMALGDNNKRSVELLYSNVERLIRKGKYDEASQELKKIIAEYPEEKHAKDMLSDLSKKLNYSAVQGHIDKARKLIEAGNYNAAEEELGKVLALERNNVIAQRLIITSRKERLASMYSEAETALKTGIFSKASDAYSNILDNNPKDTSTRGAAQRLAEVMRVVPTVNIEGEVGHALRASIYHYVAEGGDRETSLAGAWYAFQLDPQSGIVQSVKEFIENKQASVIKYMEPLSRESTVVDQYLYSALNHIYEARYDIAAKKCAIVLAISPDNVLALKRSGSSNYMMGRRDLAEAAWRRALELTPDDNELKGFLGL